ncbi:MAG TPA: hypothetical protein VLG71_03390 [Candidatus Limnocylindria bacterium]|nr:hypothetical protein [Candidatus Limnocylindria bacterium]
MKHLSRAILACIITSHVHGAHAASTVAGQTMIIPVGQETYEQIKAKYPFYRDLLITRIPSKERYIHRKKIALEHQDIGLLIHLKAVGYRGSNWEIFDQKCKAFTYALLSFFAGAVFATETAYRRPR